MANLIKRKSIEAQSNTKEGVRPTARKKVKYEPVTISESEGCRFLHFGTRWVQGAMRLRKPDWIELAYTQQMMAWMLFNDAPYHVAQFGLGTAALTKFCYRTFPQTLVTTVELNPAVIAVCQSMFKLPENDERLNVIEMDAADFVEDSQNFDTLDILQVDVYDAAAKGPMLDSLEFYQGCARCLKQNGIITVNLFGDHPSYLRNVKTMNRVFERVLCFPELPDGNVIAIGFNTSPEIDIAILYEHAAAIQLATKLPAKSWVRNIESAINNER